MLQHTPLFDQHQQSGAKLVDFFGWEMPLHYGSQIEEHHQVRKNAGLFDVSHMGVVDIDGSDSIYFLRYLLANDVIKLQDHKALYTCMLNEVGGVVDDLIVYRLGDNQFRLVVNAGTRKKDITWVKQHAERYDVTIVEREDLAIIALQGPNSLTVLTEVLGKKHTDTLAELKPFQLTEIDSFCIARTGYTGENGFELILPTSEAVSFWQKCVKAGASPCGLGARDTLRLEAGLNLYGSDMDENTSPLVSNLSWTIDWKDQERDFIGRAALQTQKEKGVALKIVGLVMEEPGVLRDKQKVFINGSSEGEITSGGFSPTLGHAIALARVPMDTDHDMTVERRGKKVSVKIVKPPFVRFGKKVF